jgi:hypothetical protein
LQALYQKPNGAETLSIALGKTVQLRQQHGGLKLRERTNVTAAL